MATWDARAWLAGLMGLERDDIGLRSIDRYGTREAQARYERGNEAVARMIVEGPVGSDGPERKRHWAVSVRIGTGSDDAHTIEIPFEDEIEY